MTYTLDIELNDPLEATIDDIIGEVEEAIENIRKCREPRLMHQVDVDIGELLAENQAIGIVWDIQHVKDQRPDLSDDQAWEVLQECQSIWERLNDPMLETIQLVAENLYPRGKEILRRRICSLLNQLDSLPEREVDDPASYGEVAAKLDELEAQAKGE